jgi:predicted RNase H-like nuclease (RuvC/YqgF family)
LNASGRRNLLQPTPARSERQSLERENERLSSEVERLQRELAECDKELEEDETDCRRSEADRGSGAAADAAATKLNDILQTAVF